MPKSSTDQLEDALWDIYAPGTNPANRTTVLGGNELPLLYALLSSPLFENTLKHVAVSTAGEKAKVKLAWIDKRPVAAVSGVKRTEYGDLAIFRVHSFKASDKKTHSRARCLLVQAKVAKAVAQLAAPRVPVNPSVPAAQSSTAREYMLLRNWPEHDMYKYGSSGKPPMVSKLDVRDPVNAWYMATPGRPPQNTLAWSSPWMCGPVEMGAACDVTFGSLLTAFLEGRDAFRSSTGSDWPVGAAFHLEISELWPSVTPSSTGLNRLCTEILRGMRGFHLPSFLTGGAQKSGLKTVTLHANPIVPALMLAWRGVSYLRRLFGREKMLVIVVATYSDD